MLELNVVAKGETKNGKNLLPGDKVGYLSHLPGGVVKVRLPDGTEDVANPHCFEELR